MRSPGLVLSFAAVAAASAGSLPLHELEALHGHEHCGHSDGPAIGHECHDHDECATCALLSLPHDFPDRSAHAIVLVEASRPPVASPCEAPSQPDRSSVSARAPPHA